MRLCLNRLLFTVFGVFTLTFVGCTRSDSAPNIGTASQALPDLFRAISKGDLELARGAIDAGANVDAAIGLADREVTPLVAAIAFERKEIALLLLSKGANPRVFHDRYRASDFALHAWGPEGEVLKALLSKGVGQ